MFHGLALLLTLQKLSFTDWGLASALSFKLSCLALPKKSCARMEFSSPIHRHTSEYKLLVSAAYRMVASAGFRLMGTIFSGLTRAANPPRRQIVRRRLVRRSVRLVPSSKGEKRWKK